MKNRTAFLAVMVALATPTLFAQVGGGSAAFQNRGSGKERAEQSERAKRSVSADERPTTANSVFLEASVLANVPADEYVALFGVSREAATISESMAQANADLDAFAKAIQGMGVSASHMHRDFVAQNRIYGYDIAGDMAQEKLVGFETKLNMAVRYVNKDFLEKLLDAAAQAKIYDLIKVDYVVRDIPNVHERLMEAAAQIIRRKAAARERLLGVKLKPAPQVYAEAYGAYSPNEMYDSYRAEESESVDLSYRQNRIVRNARKARTFYYNGLDSELFDLVLNPAPVEPMVQFTLHLKLRYEMAGPTAPSAKPASPAAKRRKAR